MRKNTAILVLRWLTCAVMVVGVLGTFYGFVNRGTVPLFIFEVPTWVIPFSGAYLGLRAWRRIPLLEKKIGETAQFKWSNFSIKRSR